MNPKQSYGDAASRVLTMWFLLTCVSTRICLADVAFPKIDAIGQPLDRLQNWMIVPTNAVFPIFVQFDLKSGKIVGVVCEYPKSRVTYSSVKSEIQSALKLNPRMSGNVTTAWRIEAKKCAVMLTFDQEKEVLRIVVRGFAE